MFSSELDLNIDVGDPDLLIRTGGESRVSDFLLWQIAYSEIFSQTNTGQILIRMNI